MSISAITGAAVSGMRRETNRMSAIADNIANLSTPGYQPARTGGTSATGSAVASTSGDNDVDPTTEMTGLVESSESFALNASVFETGAEIWDVLKTINRSNSDGSSA